MRTLFRLLSVMFLSVMLVVVLASCAGISVTPIEKSMSIVLKVKADDAGNHVYPIAKYDYKTHMVNIYMIGYQESVRVLTVCCGDVYANALCVRVQDDTKQCKAMVFIRGDLAMEQEIPLEEANRYIGGVLTLMGFF